jgi:hypothetical protein
MEVHFSAMKRARLVCSTIVILAIISNCGSLRAQMMNWPQHSTAQQPYDANMSAPPLATPPYEVASLPANVSQPMEMHGPPYSWTSAPCTPCYPTGPQPPNQMNVPSVIGGEGSYPSYCAGGDYSTMGYGYDSYPCRPPVQWFGYAGALMLDRDDENHRLYSYDSNDEAYQLLDSQETNFDLSGGVEVHLGRMDACSGRGCELVYWGLFPNDGYAYAYPSQVSGDLNAIFNFDQLDYNGQTADNYVNDAAVHRLYRHTELNNVELNCIWNLSNCHLGGNNCCCSPCCHGGCACRPGCKFQALAGFRYLRFEDNLGFGSDPSDTQFTGEVDELYYNIDCDNDFFGVQFGGAGEQPLGGSAWSVTFGAKAGIFLNDADAYSTIGGAAGLARINNGPNNGVAWNVESHDDTAATIAELNAGIVCSVSPTWRLRGDCRVIGISGVALPTNQIYQDLRGIQDVALISTNGEVILHGVFVGLERVY